MGRNLYENFPAAREVFEEASSALGFDMAQLCFNGPQDLLDQTEYTQLAVLTCELACERVFNQNRPPRPTVMAGHSVGEYAALVAAGILDRSCVFPLVQARARYHQEAVLPGRGGMAALLGMELKEAERECRQASLPEDRVFVSIINAPGQVVVSGHVGALSRLGAGMAARRGIKFVPLPISVPCHCELVSEGAKRLACLLEEVNFSPGSCPVIPNCDANVFYTPEEARNLLVRQMTERVQWQETILQMVHLGVETIVELGPRRTLANLVKRIAPDLKVLSVEDQASWEKAVSFLHE
jgi:[acyl-carrier-protein] S-malonyltransferase